MIDESVTGCQASGCGLKSRPAPRQASEQSVKGGRDGERHTVAVCAGERDRERACACVCISRKECESSKLRASKAGCGGLTKDVG